MSRKKKEAVPQVTANLDQMASMVADEIRLMKKRSKVDGLSDLDFAKFCQLHDRQQRLEESRTKATLAALGIRSLRDQTLAQLEATRALLSGDGENQGQDDEGASEGDDDV